MGKYLSKPVTSKELERGTGPGFQWGLAAMQGWRVTMEDMYIFEPTFKHLETFSLFLVLDGFGGSKFTKHVSQKFASQMKTKFTVKGKFLKNALVFVRSYTGIIFSRYFYGFHALCT